MASSAATAIVVLLAFATPVRAQLPGFETVDIVVAGRRAATIKAYIARPSVAAEAKVATVVALHGCGGLFTARGALQARDSDWVRRLAAEGYAVVLPDSFTSRGYRQICTLSSAERQISPRDRVLDVAATLDWLGRQAFIDRERMALLGWSNGGSTVLWSIDAAASMPAPPLKAAIAFYPGCRGPATRAGYAPAVPLTILIGDADDWTPPGPCRDLASRHAVRLIEYAGAVHGFDAPASPRRTRTDAGQSPRGDGRVEVGTDPAARTASIEVVRDILSRALAAPR